MYRPIIKPFISILKEGKLRYCLTLYHRSVVKIDNIGPLVTVHFPQELNILQSSLKDSKFGKNHFNFLFKTLECSQDLAHGNIIVGLKSGVNKKYMKSIFDFLQIS